MIAWRFFPSCGAAEAAEVLDESLPSRFPKTARAPGLALRSDGGSQFAAHRFQETAGSSGSNSRSPASGSPRRTGWSRPTMDD